MMDRIRAVKIVHDIIHRADYVFVSEFFRLMGVFVCEGILDILTERTEKTRAEEMTEFDFCIYVGKKVPDEEEYALLDTGEEAYEQALQRLPADTVYFYDMVSMAEVQKVDGIIAFGIFTSQEIDFLRSLSYAIVFVNSNQNNYEFDQVQIDFDQGQKQVVSYLLDQKRYTGLGYIGGIYNGQNGSIGTHRLAAIKKILQERGQYDPRTFHVGEISRESGYCLAKKAVEEHTLAEAMLLGSDEVAEGVLDAFRELGVRIPKDVAVIIYQDIQTLESKWPTGTCLEMYPDYVWENALELLFGRISQRRTQPVTVMVPPQLKIGDTA